LSEMRKTPFLVAIALVCMVLVPNLYASSPDVVLILISREGGRDPDLMIKKEVGVMMDMLKQAGFVVKVSSPAGKAIVGSKITLTPDLKNADVVIADYVGVMMPCMAQPFTAPGEPPVPALVKKTVAAGKPLAAQTSAIDILGRAGVLKGKQLAARAGSGVGVIKDGNIITSTDCPYMALMAGSKDGTVELTRLFIDLLKSHAAPNP
jgi:hypothetical protein